MSHWTDAFAEHEARHRKKVLADTFGHLEPQPGHTYAGRVITARPIYDHGNVVILACDFPFEGGPSFYRDIHDHFETKCPDIIGGVWVWEGTLRIFKNGGSRWSGKLRPQRLVDRFPSRPAASQLRVA